MMFFSIIIPTYNRANSIGKVIDSILFQSYPNFEILIIDDGSTDTTSDVVGTYSDIRIRYFKKWNEERAAARNFGVKLAKGDYITFLDSDDYLLPDHFYIARDFIRNNNMLPWFHLPYSILKEGKELFSTCGFQDKDGMELLNGNFLSCMGVFLRADVAHANLFNEDRELSASEDHELWIRIASQYSLKVGVGLTSVLVQHDARSVSITEPKKLIRRQELFLKYVFENFKTRDFIGKNSAKVRSNSLSYVSLHLALTGKNKLTCIFYLLKSIWLYPFFLSSRRFSAIVKHLIFTF